MNNTQFRRLVLDTPTANHGSGSAASARQDGTTPSALGSRMRSSIPMTPRSVAGSTRNDFASQLAQRNAELNPDRSKKFKSSLAPKGTKLAAGYEDRTKLRVSEEEDDKASRVKALEEMLKLGQMDEATFQKLRDEIVGQSIQDVHLVKGLDYKLLERVRRGEDVYSEAKDKDETATAADSQPLPDLDDELDKIEEHIVAPLQKENKIKQGTMAPPSLRGTKRTRDDILRDMRAARATASAQSDTPSPALSSKFKKLGDRERSRIEKDAKGQEVLILVDADGNVKRKVRKVRATEKELEEGGLLMPDKTLAPLGMEVTPDTKLEPQQRDDGDIFEGIGADYNPLGDLGAVSDHDSTDTSSEADDDAARPATATESEAAPSTEPGKKGGQQRRTYFDDRIEPPEAGNASSNPLQDPMIMAALQRASKIHTVSTDLSEEVEDQEKAARRRKMLEVNDRDAQDMDLEFGSSRMGDGEDGEEDQRVRLSVWGKEGQGQDRGSGPSDKRKRGPKKKTNKKGDGENMADVMKVLERRKAK